MWNPYVGYDEVNQRPFVFHGPIDGHLLPMLRVMVVEHQGETAVFPYSELEQRRVITDTIGGRPVAIFWEPDTVSALDQADISSSRMVGSTGVFSPVVGGRSLTFSVVDGQIRDRETDSTWNLLGQATNSQLAGEQLEPIVRCPIGSGRSF